MKILNLKTFFVTVGLVLFLISSINAQDIDDGIDAVKRGNYVLGLEILKKYVKDDDSYDANYYYGKALFETGSLKEAEKYFNIALKDDDSGVEALKGLGDIYSEQKNYDKANTYYEKALKEDEENVSVLLSQGINYSRSGDVEKAVFILTRAMSLDDKNPAVFVALGNAYYFGQALPAAIENYKKALQLSNNKSAAAYYGLGNVYFRQRKFDDALTSFQESIKIDENFAESYFMIGRILFLSEQYASAAEAFKKYSQLKPGTQTGNSYFARTKYALGDLQEAERLLNEVLKVDPNNALAFKYLGYIEIDKKNYDKALEYFSKVSEDNFETEDYIKLAKIYSEKGDQTKAFQLMDEAKKRDPENPDLYFELGVMQFNAKQYDDALVSFNKNQSIAGKSDATQVYKGLIMYTQEKYDDAIAEFEEAIRINDTFTFSYLWLANAYLAKDNKEKALENYEKVLQLDPTNEEAAAQVEKLKNLVNGTGQ
ncbi:MAG: tetratricopeptide repeat protein [Ignavibacteriaceae bacterium]|nr:MAG: tetratricopeptide repeat protein [Chlorobiota bacterium]MBV6398747.1 Beta-barrel assembly-enhancing protease [Ignavibacteria bacterium]MCC6885081.1 tetratricopeptide repeat protein [Ignavibacteriales bacterium]MCE7952128.1 tetratricopeptide repeat protein [Chlorobi bacterium CHB7]MDL1886315.1 tetratricopeptide repeat protein [Ignavibacteria bacterium CHB1]MEB2329414.1 tetratricopeptide repeat protein [Ignavibacteriaceae bacterium]RIK49468.1 MAG: hypothetical protein DCC60_04000 [Ignav